MRPLTLLLFNLSIFVTIAYSQSPSMEDLNCPCLEEMIPKSNEIMQRNSGNLNFDMQSYTICAQVEMFECALTCVDDANARTEYQRVITEGKRNASQMGINCQEVIRKSQQASSTYISINNFSSPSDNSSFTLDDFPRFDRPNSAVRSGQSINSDNPLAAFYQSNSEPSSNSKTQKTLADNGGYSINNFDGSLKTSFEATSVGLAKTAATGKLDADLVVGGLGLLFNGLNSNAQRKAEEEERRRQEKAIAKRKQEAESARLEDKVNKQAAFLSILKNVNFPASVVPNIHNYFFFIVKEDDQSFSFSKVFSIPSKSDYSLPYRSDVIAEFKKKSGKGKVWLQGIFTNAEEAKSTLNFMKQITREHHYQIKKDRNFFFSANYSIASKTKHKSGSSSFWGTSNKEEGAIVTKQNPSDWGGIKKQDAFSIPKQKGPSQTKLEFVQSFYAMLNHSSSTLENLRFWFWRNLKDIYLPATGWHSESHFFYVIMENEETVSFSEVFPIPQQSDGTFPRIEDVLENIQHNVKNENVWLQGIFTDKSQALSVRNELADIIARCQFKKGENYSYTFQ